MVPWVVLAEDGRVIDTVDAADRSAALHLARVMHGGTVTVQSRVSYLMSRAEEQARGRRRED